MAAAIRLSQQHSCSFVERVSVRWRRLNGSARDFFPSFKTVLNSRCQRGPVGRRWRLQTELVMRIDQTRLCTIAVIAMVAGGSLFSINYPGWNATGEAVAASAQEKTQARQSLNEVMSLLRGVDTAYASGNSAEAQTKFDQARANWNKISPLISAREAREQQLLFDSLGSQLKSGGPATKVKATVRGMLGELREDIQRELR